jgi:branched-chain amino acid transport system permease protein
MASLGVTFMLQGLVRLFFGTSSRNLYIDDRKEIFRLELPWELASRKIVITEPQILLFVFMIIAVVALHYFLTHSRLGKAMRAMSDNADLARVSGINVNVVVTVTWIIAGSLAAAAGTLLSLDVALKPDLSFNLLLPVFAAAIVGGVGHVYGAVLGGFVVGFAESLAVFNWAVILRPTAKAMEWDLPSSLALVPTEYKITVPFFILIAILVLRPTGILKGKVL